jgi:hypothetical protein
MLTTPTSNISNISRHGCEAGSFVVRELKHYSAIQKTFTNACIVVESHGEAVDVVKTLATEIAATDNDLSPISSRIMFICGNMRSSNHNVRSKPGVEAVVDIVMCQAGLESIERKVVMWEVQNVPSGGSEFYELGMRIHGVLYPLWKADWLLT